MGIVIVFEPDADYGRVDVIRNARRMPVRGLKFVASVTGRWKVVKIVEFGEVESDLASQLDLISGLDENAIVLGQSKIRRSVYRDYTALVRIDVDANVDLDRLRDLIAEETGTVDPEDPDERKGEVDIVMGAFDMLAVVVDNDEGSLGDRILAIRKIPGVTRTESLRVIDYASTSDSAPDDHRVSAAD